MSVASLSRDKMAPEQLEQLRDAKFKAWLQNKALKDKAFEYLAKINPDRAHEDESLMEVAIAICAVERMLGEDDVNKTVTKQHSVEEEAPAANKFAPSVPAKTLRSAFIKWAVEHHTFNNVVLTEKEVSSLSGGGKEDLTSEREMAANGQLPQDVIDAASRTKNIFQSMKYMYPAQPKKPGDVVKPLTSDQKVKNGVITREIKAFYRKAQKEMLNRVKESVARKVRSMASGKGSSNEESERKGKADAADSRVSTPRSNYADDNPLLAARLETQILNDLSIKQLRLWLEEDEDARIARENAANQEKLKEKKQAHEQFVKKKDSVRIRMPDNITPPPAAPMGYGRELDGVRPAIRPVTTTVDLMAGSGLKYVHATKKERPGIEGDLERSRKQLLKMGFVNKDNFEEDDMSAYNRELRENAVAREKQEAERKQKEDSAKAFEDWLVLKEMRDQALHCLRLLPRPAAEDAGTAGDLRTSRMSVTASVQHNASMLSTSKLRNGPEAHHAIEVGKALKKVDRTLFKEWAVWCEGVFRANIASILWDCFPPIACDVHSATYSQVRDSFMKLLRPGVDFRATFMEFVESNIFARRIRKLKDDKEYYSLRDDAKDEVDEEIQTLRKQWLENVSINKTQMKTLLRQMGITLKDAEMRTLIDAFDANGDGVVTLSEFLDFTGPKRDKRGGTSLVLNQKCCWMTTCRVTGMANGYSVSNATKRYLKYEETKNSEGGSGKNSTRNSSSGRRSGGDYEDEDQEAEETYSKESAAAGEGGGDYDITLTGNVVIRKLANGESRMCVELKERGKREDILRKFGLVRSLEAIAEGDRKRRDQEDEDEENEYEDDYDDDEEGEGGGGGNKSKNNKDTKGKSLSASQKAAAAASAPCDFSTWSTEDRRKGLKYLYEITKDLRQEETIKNLLASGSAPKPPKFFVDNEVTLETRSKLRHENSRHSNTDEDLEEADINSTSLQLHWEPEKGDLISFYSIEWAGAVGATKLGDAKYVEIFRDPKDADPDSTFSFSFVKGDLQPGCSYRFRIRAFNGYGPSDYTYKVFTTRTTGPIKPRVIRIAHDSVTLRWTFTEGFFRRLEELRKIFQIADRDNSGQVSREELTAVLDAEASGSPALKKFLTKVAAGMGIDLSQGYGALFDKIEADDDGGLSWTEFENFFMSAGWGDTLSIAGGAAALNASHLSLKVGTVGGTGTVATAATSASAVAVKPAAINYIIQRCTSEFDDKYVEVLRTSAGQAAIHRLEPGTSYRFRIYSLNADQVASPYSPSVLVHTLLETPALPTVRAVSARKISLSWLPRNHSTSTRDKAAVERMLGEWAGSHGENDGGVSIEAAFAKYDTNRSGDIDAKELESLLKDLGVEVTPERIAEAFTILDTNGDGVISYEEFGKWWRREEVTYTLKRSEEIPPPKRVNARFNMSNLNNTLAGEFKPTQSVIEQAILEATRGALGSARAGGVRPRTDLATIPEGTAGESVNGRGATPNRTRPASAGATGRGGSNNNKDSASYAAGTQSVAAAAPKKAAKQVGVPIVSYRGTRTRAELGGLVPNNLYHFRLRYTGSRSNSELSEPLIIMTAPLPPSAPVLINLSSSSVQVKWYPPEFGAFKFIVQMKMINILPNSDTLTLNPNRKNATTSLVGIDVGDGWVQVYNGQENNYVNTVLATSSTYLMRVVSVNCQGGQSEPSEVISFTTLDRGDTSTSLTVENAARQFTIECNGDICVGDTILISERLYAKSRRPDGSTADVKASTVGAKTFKGGNKKLNMSVTSLNADGVTITESHGPFIGERTIAAYVAKDNYRTIRDILTELKVTPGNSQEVGKHRKLWLEVVWQKSSNAACKPFQVKPGDVLERLQGHLEEFEVFRVPWKTEKARIPFEHEYRSLVNCYVQADC